LQYTPIGGVAMKINRKRTGGEYYVYVYLDPRKLGIYAYGEYEFDHEPIYVGKGKRKRAYYFEKRNPVLKNKLAKFGKPIVKILVEKVAEAKALKLEKTLIALIGRFDLGEGPLCNLTDGGEGASGCIRSEEFKQNLRNRTVSEETRKKLSDGAIGKKKTPWSEETKRKVFGPKKEKVIKVPRKGGGWNKGQKMNKPAWNKGKHTGSFCRNNDKPAWNKGRKDSKEVRNKKSVGITKWHCKRKLTKEITASNSLKPEHLLE